MAISRPSYSPFFLSFFFLFCPFLFTLFPPEVPPWECVRSHSLLCCIEFAREHNETAKNLCRYNRPFNRGCPQSTVSEKMTSRSVFRCAGREPTITPIQVLSQRQTAWLGWSPVTSRCKVLCRSNFTGFNFDHARQVATIFNYISKSHKFIIIFQLKHLARQIIMTLLLCNTIFFNLPFLR